MTNKPYETKEEIRKGRYDAVPYVLYFDQDDDDSVFGYNWGKETGAGAHTVFLLGPGTLAAVLEVIGFMMLSERAVALTDVASQAVFNFAAMGEEREAMLAGACWHLQQEGTKFFSPEHPEIDPMYGLNDKLTELQS